MRSILALAACLVLTSTFVRAQTVDVPVMDIAPWGYMENGEPAGHFVDISRAIAEEAGLTPNITIVPYRRMITMMENDHPGFFLMSANSSIKPIATQVAKIAEVDVVVFTTAAGVGSLSDLEGKRIATLFGTAHHKPFEENEKIAKHAVKSPDLQVRLMAQGRVDGMLDVRPALDHAMAKAKSDGSPLPTIGSELVLGKITPYAWTAKTADGQALAARLATAVDTLTANGAISAVFAGAQ